MNSGWPPLTPFAAEGVCTECVPSKTTGANARMMGQAAHIHDKVVVAKAGSALGEANTLVAAVANLGDRVLHVGGSDKLTLLDVDSSTSLCGGDQQVGLAAEERWNLENEFDVSQGVRKPRTVLGRVDVGEHWKARFLCDGSQDTGAFHQARSAKAVDAGAIRLVVAGLEDVGQLEVGSDAGYSGFASPRACASLSRTHGPAMRNNWPRPTGTASQSRRDAEERSPLYSTTAAARAGR